MTTVREVKLVATAALLLVAVAACGGGGNDPSTKGSPPPVSPTHTVETTTAAPPTDSEVASAAATALVRKYFSVLDELRQHPGKPIGELATVATSTQLTAQTRLLERERSQQLHQVGATKVADVKVQSVNLDNSDPAAGKVPTVTVDVCWDVNGADLVDKTGKSVVSSTRADKGWTRYTVANYRWTKNRTGGWRIASGQDLRQTPCSAS